MVHQSSDEVALLRRVASGDGEALLALHQRYVNLVYSMALHVLQDRALAEEVTQDVFLKLWQRSERYDVQRGQFSTWLLSVTRFAAIDRLRYEGRRRSVSLTTDDGAAEIEIEHADHGEWERGQHLRLLLEELPAEQRDLIEMAYFGGMTHSDLAEHFNLPLGTVKSRLRLGLQRLRSLWLSGSTQEDEQ